MRSYEDAYTRRIREEGFREGFEEGFKEGLEEAIEEMREEQRALAERLTADNRGAEIPLIITDPTFFDVQFAAYFPNGLPASAKSNGAVRVNKRDGRNCRTRGN